MSTPMSLNILTKSGVDRALPLAFSFERRHGDGHVPVAGEGVIARQGRGNRSPWVYRRVSSSASSAFPERAGRRRRGAARCPAGR